MTQTRHPRVPTPTDADAIEFWAACADGKLLISVCADCGRHHFYSRRRCPYCHGANVTKVAASGRGTVYSYTVIHRAPTAYFASLVPYAVGLVELDEGPRLLTWLRGIEPESVTVGLPVQVDFEDLDDGLTVHQFVPVADPKP
jgi:uncharacterized OB-fold protein